MTGRLVARMGALLSLVVLGLLLLPYGLLDASEISVYYGVGPVSPLFLAVLPVVTAVALLGGARGRSDPVTAAGAAVAVSGVLGVLVGLWMTEAGAVVGGLTVDAVFDRHRFALLTATAILFVITAVFAKAALSGDVPQSP